MTPSTIYGPDKGCASLSGEEWQPIPSLPGYEASTLGHIRRVATGYVLKGEVDRYGYQRISFSGKKRKVHRLVCEAFHGPPTAEHCAHIDGVRLNNKPGNLVWATRLENEAHKIAHGTRPRPQVRRRPPRSHRPRSAITNAWVRLTDEQVTAMRERRTEGLSVRALAREFGVCKRTAQRIVRNESRTA